MHLSLSFAPHIPFWLLWLSIALSAVAVGYAFFVGATGAWARGLALAVLLLALANPLIVKETREGLSNIVALIIDRSQSMGIQNRGAQEDAALAAIRKQLARETNLEVRESVVTTTTTGEDNGTQLFAGVQLRQQGGDLRWQVVEVEALHPPILDRVRGGL